MSKSFNMTDTSSLTTNAAVAEDGTPSAKRQRTSAEVRFLVDPIMSPEIGS
jgi:hypothetical protein